MRALESSENSVIRLRMTQGIDFWDLGQVADDRLLDRVRSLVRADRRVSARLLAHLAEVEERRLHLKQAKSSMFEYCTELGMSEDEAGRRLCAASVAKRFPIVYRMLDQGKLSLSVICKLKHYLTESNYSELLAGVAGMSYRRAETWLAAQFPEPDAPSAIRKLPDPQRAERRAQAMGSHDEPAQPAPGPTPADKSGSSSNPARSLPSSSDPARRATSIEAASNPSPRIGIAFSSPLPPSSRTSSSSLGT
jgi:hypothetical protein